MSFNDYLYQVSGLRRQLAMDKDAAFQDLQVKNQYLASQVEQMEKVTVQTVSATSAVSTKLLYFIVVWFTVPLFVVKSCSENYKSCIVRNVATLNMV